MKKQVWIIIAALIAAAAAALAAFWYWYVPDFSSLIRADTSYLDEYSWNEQLCETFFQEHMISQSFDIYTNYLETTQKQELATGHDILSESYGLLMMRAVKTDDKALFDRCYQYITENLQYGDLISWRKNSASGELSAVNAGVDDLRIIQALIYGYEKWGQKELYRSARKWSGLLYKHNVENGCFLDTYDAATETTVKNATLCYQNLQAFRLLGKIDFRWKKVYENALKIIDNGYLQEGLPLFQTRWNAESGKYETEEINSIESLLTALHLAEIDELNPETLNWLKKQVQNGTLFSRYDRESGQPSTQYQSTAAYAISAMIGAVSGDEELSHAAAERMNLYQIRNEQSEIFGAYGFEEEKAVYSFDNLYALLAFCY